MSNPLGVNAFPLGRRGERGCLAPMGYSQAYRMADFLPGAKASSEGLRFSVDQWNVVKRLAPIHPFPQPEVPPLRGMAKYEAKFKEKLRGYQREMVKFLVTRSYAINADPMRSGKTPTTLAAATAVGCEKVLIVCPNIAKLVWATEIVKWLGEPALILDGRAGDESRLFCPTCNGTGRRAATDPAYVVGKRNYCPDCKAKNGQSYGYKLYLEEVLSDAALNDARWVIVNYDLLIPQFKHDDFGKKLAVEDLPGWARKLKYSGFNLCIVDEAHLLRGRTKLNNKGESKRDRLLQVATDIERLWALTGTPIYGRVADLWSMLDVVTDGLWGRPFFTFDKHFCNGRKGQYGWENDGAENTDELLERLKMFMLKRDRKEILPEMPAKLRQVHRIDSSRLDFRRPAGNGPAGLHGALRVTAKLKEPVVVENVTTECMEGAKVIVFAYQKSSVASLAAALSAAGDTGKGTSVPLKARNFRVWAMDGGTPVEQRFKMAENFRAWTGAAAFVATIDSCPVAISLNGAQSVHFADLTFDPASLLQAEDRPYEVGTKGLTIVYYVVQKTIDEHVLDIVLPKMTTLENVAGERVAGDFKAAFNGVEDRDALAEEIWNRMSAAAEKVH